MMYYRVTTKFYDDGKVDVLVDTVYKKEQPKNFSCEFNLTGKKSSTSISGVMNCPIVF